MNPTLNNSKYSDQTLQTMFDATHDNALLLDLEGAVVAINAAAAHSLGKDPARVIGQNIFQLLPPRASEYRRKMTQEVIEEKSPVTFEEEIHGMFFDWNIYPVFSETGEVSRLAIFGQDITQWKKAEERLIKTRNFLKTILDSSLDGITRTDMRGNIRYTSPRACRMLGYDPEEVLGKNISDFFEGGSADLTPIKRELKKNGELTHYEIALKTKQGGLRHFSLSASLIEDENDKTIGFIGVYRDITQRKRIREQFLEAQKVEALGTLASGIAHQFNNALTAITGNIGLMEMDLADDDKFMRNIHDMKISAQRMAHLTTQLLAYAKGGRYQLQKTPALQFLETTLSLISHTLKPKTRIETDFPTNLMPIKADRTQMQMVISAVIANACEAIDESGRIRISAENVTLDASSCEGRMKPGAYVQIRIQDDGKGMDEEIRNRIFDPFFTTHFIGRGLGMAAVYGIITNHHGSISVLSKPGKGTTITINLPAIEEVVTHGTKSTPGVKQITSEDEGTILVIEDEPDVMEITHATLKRLGYEVIEATTGKEALLRLEEAQKPIDVALLDVKLPDMNGLQLYTQIMENRPALKVLVFSGYAQDGPVREILNSGADGFIQKPFSIKSLSKKLKEILNP